jgi:two-component system, cell cycle sensor histidine kinase and response regulator CckA
VPKVLNLNDTVEGLLSMLRRLIGEDIHLAWRPGKTLPPVRIDPTQIDQILVNLCVNARDAITGAGEIAIETGTAVFSEADCARHAEYLPGDYVRMAVTDNGCGMDAETLSQLFEPFFTTKSVGKGTGLGLATLYGIVRQNRGFVHVYSEPGKGTTFTVYLPRHAEEAAERLPAPSETEPSSGHETILLVEDDPALLAMTRAMLERQGHSVLTAASPGEAIRLARRHTGLIDLLMTDVIMPEMNGRDLARHLITRQPGLKRLFMSGYTADVIAHHGVLNPGVHFIQKPFTMRELAAKLNEALERNRS